MTLGFSSTDTGAIFSNVTRVEVDAVIWSKGQLIDADSSEFSMWPDKDWIGNSLSDCLLFNNIFGSSLSGWVKVSFSASEVLDILNACSGICAGLYGNIPQALKSVVPLLTVAARFQELHNKSPIQIGIWLVFVQDG